MKKFLKIIGILFGVVVLLVIGFLGYLKVSGMPTYSDNHRPTTTVESSPLRIERGRKIVTMLCYDCHYNPSTNRLSGHHLPEMPEIFGEIYSRNITGDKEHGIGNWTDGEIMYFLRTGIKKNDEYVPPYMPKFPHLADEDMSSVIAFLRSGDSLVSATPIEDTAVKPSMLALFLGRFVFKPLDYPAAQIAEPAATDKVAIGKYWANGVIGCYQCHSADFKTNQEVFPEQSVGFFGGGNEMKDASGKIIYTANITPDPVHGIGKWSEEDFLHALRDGLRPDNTALKYPMSRMPELTDSEIVAIYAYLKTVPALATPRKQSADYKFVSADPSQGEKTYFKYACYACHGTNGVGMCDLTHACEKYHNDEELIEWIKNPSKKMPGTKMPTWEGTIPEAEFMPLATYVRQLGTKAIAASKAAATQAGK